MDYFENIKSLCLKQLNQSNNFKIQESSIKLFAKLIKISQSSEDKKNMLLVVESEFMKTNSYYKRRLYMSFFEYLVHFFSMQFLAEHKVISNILYLLNNTPIYPVKIVDTLAAYIPVIESGNLKCKDEIYYSIKQLTLRKNLDKEPHNVSYF